MAQIIQILTQILTQMAAMMVLMVVMVVCLVGLVVPAVLMVVLMVVLMAEMAQTVSITKRIHMVISYLKSQNKYRIKRIKKRSQLNKPQISHQHNPYNHLQELSAETLLLGRLLHQINQIPRLKVTIIPVKMAQVHKGRFQLSKKRKVKRD